MEWSVFVEADMAQSILYDSAIFSVAPARLKTQDE